MFHPFVKCHKHDTHQWRESQFSKVTIIEIKRLSQRANMNSPSPIIIEGSVPISEANLDIADLGITIFNKDGLL